MPNHPTDAEAYLLLQHGKLGHDAKTALLATLDTDRAALDALDTGFLTATQAAECRRILGIR